METELYLKIVEDRNRYRSLFSDLKGAVIAAHLRYPNDETLWNLKAYIEKIEGRE